MRLTRVSISSSGISSGGGGSFHASSVSIDPIINGTSAENGRRIGRPLIARQRPTVHHRTAGEPLNPRLA